MRPVGGGDRGHEIGDARAVLGDADALAVAGPAVAIGHMARALLVGDGDEAYAGGLEQVEGIHIGGAHDAADMGHAMSDEGLDEGLARGHAGHGLSSPVARPALAWARRSALAGASAPR